MQIPQRGVIATVTAAVLLGAPAAVAPAKVAPEPYNTWDGSGNFTGDSAVGPSSCGMSNLVARARSARGGALVDVRTFDAKCTGVITEAEPDEIISFRVRRGKVTGDISIVISHAVGPGGKCRYTGPVTGTARKGTGTVAAAGTVTLQETLAGVCAPDSKTTLKVKLPGAKLSW
jgi:hypothetical protein